MKILAFDQASKNTGWSFFEDGKLKGNGLISVSGEIGERLNSIRIQINNLIDQYDPDEIVFEDIQLQSNVGNNVATYKKLAEVLGVCEQLATERKISYEIVPALTWKNAVGIKGRTRPQQKENAKKFVKERYYKSVSEDESDAICIGHYKACPIPSTGLDWSK